MEEIYEEAIDRLETFNTLNKERGYPVVSDFDQAVHTATTEEQLFKLLGDMDKYINSFTA
jgi:hypothetical protein